jgi:hypothetical protein
MATTEVSCIAYGISLKTLGVDFIQESADNIDLNTETIDGKKYYALYGSSSFSDGARS